MPSQKEACGFCSTTQFNECTPGTVHTLCGLKGPFVFGIHSCLFQKVSEQTIFALSRLMRTNQCAVPRVPIKILFQEFK